MPFDFLILLRCSGKIKVKKKNDNVTEIKK